MRWKARSDCLFLKHAMPRVLAVQAFIGTLMSICRGRRTRNCASRSSKSALITVVTVLGGSSLHYKKWVCWSIASASCG